MKRFLIAAFALMLPVVARAQSSPKIVYPPELSSGVPTYGVSFGAAGGNATPVDANNPLPTAGKQESVTLVTANTPAAAVTVYGGNYAFAQGCTTYGTLTLRYRGPDGATMLTLVSKTATDASGATLVQLGSNAVIDATVSGTTGCNASLSRVP